jgi:CspA family cold shock protein
MSSSDTSASVRLTGRVKWFNNKTGFGFITIVGGNDQFKDASEIFAHHSAIKVSQEQYRYLVEGEYVEFSVSNTAAGDHKFQAADIRGVKGGKLFCETRYEQRAANSGSGSGSGAGHAQSRGSARDGERPVRGRQTTRGGSRGGRGEWMLVRKDSSEYRGGSTRGGGAGAGGGGRGRGGRVYSTRPSDESYVEYSQPQPQANAVSESAPVVASTSSNASATTTQSSDVPATPRAASTRKPRQSKPSS